FEPPTASPSTASAEPPVISIVAPSPRALVDQTSAAELESANEQPENAAPSAPRSAAAFVGAASLQSTSAPPLIFAVMSLPSSVPPTLKSPGASSFAEPSTTAPFA